MKDKERDIFDDLLREKLYDFEADTLPGDWEAIADRLPAAKTVPFRRTLRYWAAAAVISLLVVTGGVYVVNRDKEPMPVAETIREKTDAVETQLAEQTQPAAPVAVAEPSRNSTDKPVVAQTSLSPRLTRGRIGTDLINQPLIEPVPVRSRVKHGNEVPLTQLSVPEESEIRPVETRALIADATPVKEAGKAPVRRWGFGMGGGSVTAGTSNSLNTFALKNTALIDRELIQLNSPYFNEQSPKINIHHKTPVTVGMGVSYYLNDRFSLQSGLNYTFLSSEWETNAVYYGETKQKLHFIGIPLSLSYKIAEWKRIQFYAAAGGMTEINVAGKLTSKIFVGNDEIRHEKRHIRMKEWMWSVNGRVGASYPLLRFLSVYAEAGAGYYFDNGSDIETIRSEKPFNVNLQAGFRLGF
ncbi:PorT family protein [Parabacteroides acidifaciens]|uniref:PorT family protein n=1 Tax=Parabacteroides acidifaciens TaxID=2290935 RepID=A0A3D8HE38_9BACT|nr:porin family protein [Parabacteroides acidifaciens]MBC8602025.1 PorT family protein [Parabacteroides acidifaciens]RDU49243.1 PorT family protein [Parabacteroides acidifaciens]